MFEGYYTRALCCAKGIWGSSWGFRADLWKCLLQPFPEVCPEPKYS